MKVQHIDIEFL